MSAAMQWPVCIVVWLADRVKAHVCVCVRARVSVIEISMRSRLHRNLHSKIICGITPTLKRNKILQSPFHLRLETLQELLRRYQPETDTDRQKHAETASALMSQTMTLFSCVC